MAPPAPSLDSARCAVSPAFPSAQRALRSRLEWESLTFGIEQWDDAQLTLRYVECVLQVVSGVGVLQLIKVDQVRPGDEARLSEGSCGGGIPAHRVAPTGCKDPGQME